MALLRKADYWEGSFSAMASPCTLLVEASCAAEARRLLDIARREAHRIEAKFSRYRDDNIVHRINNSNGQPVEVDEETALLLDYAANCHTLTEGRFDITSGVLRRAWRFDGSDRVPSAEAVAALLPHIGWHRVTWQRPLFTLPTGMEVDFGGIGKEYAVDRTALLLRTETDASFLVNYGGDLFASGPRVNGNGWQIGLEDPTANDKRSGGGIELRRGGIATSGDARRFVIRDGVRYGHILDPRTGWPAPQAPHSVTVLADTCLEAGMLATFAILLGAQAETFLDAQQVRYHILR
jgi:thiamine biosynthesis lipoprotein